MAAFVLVYNAIVHMCASQCTNKSTCVEVISCFSCRIVDLNRKVIDFLLIYIDVVQEPGKQGKY